MIAPVPSNRSRPEEIKRFLRWVGLAKRNPLICTWSLYMKPIAFIDQRSRNDWFRATGSLAKRYDPVKHFVDYTREQILRGKFTMFGLFSFWRFDKSEHWVQSFDAEKHQTRNRYWSENCERVGIVVVVRYKKNRDVQLIVFDPFHQQWKKDGGKEPRIATWKRQIAQAIMDKIYIDEIWHGGNFLNAFDFMGLKLEDSTQQSAGFVWNMVEDRVPEDAWTVERMKFVKLK
ncbi:hypothetical protein F5Y15DRAFT_398590 [Xylariaceae sp. FL0016]|nr:hypothetical protein F5Y15DRAFT_398590 [Xylariaceae sp. FL0016]